MSEAPRRIGILGGMGPEATVLLMARIIARTPAEDDKDHIPMIVDNNTQIPSRIRHLIEGTGEDPGPVLAEMARGLARAGATALAMPCNTAHAYAPAIMAAIDIPFLDMVAATADRVATLVERGGRAGILASPAVEQTGLFDRALARHGIETIFAADKARILGAIRALKRSATDAAAIDTLNDTARELMNAGADCMIVACSEFSLRTAEIEAGCPILDSVDVLAEEVVAFAKPAG